MGWGALSPSYQKAADEAATQRRWMQVKARAAKTAMELGPRLEGPWLVIPSNWYDPNAASFWKALGARYHTGDPEDRIWILDTRRARYDGKRYTRWAWLRSVRRRYFELFPELEGGCDD